MQSDPVCTDGLPEVTPSMGGVARLGESVAPNQYRLWDIDRNAGVPDNATDDKAFLDRLVLNAHVTKRSYLSAAWESTRISQQVCAAALAPAVFVRLRDGRMVAADLMALNATLVALASATLLVVSPQALSSQAILQAARQGGLLLVGLYNMAPLYQTLTRPISSDTIVAASVVLSLVHLYLHDYAFERSITEGLAGSLSVGAAVATAVLLASRLNASDEVFPYLTFALGTYILSPYFRRTVMHASDSGHLLW